MSDNKVKTYTSRDRGSPEQTKPYVPQWQILGKEPGEFKSAVVPENTKVATPKASDNNPRVRKAAIRQPYAEAVTSPVGRGRGPIPNVGNNVEHTWSSVDGDIVDDLSSELPVDPDRPMIDNNDYVTPLSRNMGLPEELPMLLDEVKTPPAKQFAVPQTTTTPAPENDLFPVVNDLEEGAYLLIVSGVPVCSGPMEEIQEQARALVFGEHEMCEGNPIPDDDIIIIKRVPIKIGLFLE
jgi:hypothetical protein